MAIWWGQAMADAEATMLNSHDLRLFGRDQLVDRQDMAIGDLLDVGFGALEIVF